MGCTVNASYLFSCGFFFFWRSLKIIVLFTERSTDWHLLLSRSSSLGQHKPRIPRRGCLCLPLPTGTGWRQTRGSSPFSSVVSGSQRQIPPCLSLQSAGQTCSQPSSLKQSSMKRLSVKSVKCFFWDAARKNLLPLSAPSVYRSVARHFTRSVTNTSVSAWMLSYVIFLFRLDSRYWERCLW